MEENIWRRTFGGEHQNQNIAETVTTSPGPGFRQLRF